MINRDPIFNVPVPLCLFQDGNRGIWKYWGKYRVTITARSMHRYRTITRTVSNYSIIHKDLEKNEMR